MCSRCFLNVQILNRFICINKIDIAVVPNLKFHCGHTWKGVVGLLGHYFGTATLGNNAAATSSERS